MFHKHVLFFSTPFYECGFFKGLYIIILSVLAPINQCQHWVMICLMVLLMLKIYYSVHSTYTLLYFFVLGNLNANVLISYFLFRRRKKSFKIDYNPLTTQIAWFSVAPLYHNFWNNKRTHIECKVKSNIIKLSSPSLQFSIYCIVAHASL